MATIADHDAYIATAPEAMRPLLAQLRTQLTQALPDAEEMIQYNMPGFGRAGRVIVGYAAFSKQCGLYLSEGAIRRHADDIAAAGLKASKTGVTFSPTKPMPDHLIAALAAAARQELGL